MAAAREAWGLLGDQLRGQGLRKRWVLPRWLPLPPAAAASIAATGTAPWYVRVGACAPQPTPSWRSLTAAPSLAGWTLHLLVSSLCCLMLLLPSFCCLCRYEGAHSGDDSKHPSGDQQQQQAQRDGSATGGGGRGHADSAVAGTVIDCPLPLSSRPAPAASCLLSH